MPIKFSNILLILILSLIACKKDKLKDNKAIFVGKWNWIETSYLDNCNPPAFIETYTPSTEGKIFSVEFLEKGCVSFFENEKQVGKFRVVFSSFDEPGCTYLSGYKHFRIDLNNDNDFSLDGCISQDTLIIKRSDFPFKPKNVDCEDYNSYFVRE